MDHDSDSSGHTKSKDPTPNPHYIVDPKFRGAVERHLAQEREMILLKRAALLENSQLKRDL